MTFTSLELCMESNLLAFTDDDYQVKMTLNEISGRATFPNIFLNGQSIGGADDLEELHETGQLAILLKENQLLLR